MNRVKMLLSQIKRGQWILISLAVGMGITAAIIGISDNPPGIILLYVSLTCLVVAWVLSWRSPRDFWILLGISLVAFPVGVVLHNLFYALGTYVSDIKILAVVLGFLDTIFFLAAVIAVGPVVVVSLVGGIYTSWRGVEWLIEGNRSIRRFVQDYEISRRQLEKLVGLAQRSSSLANFQPIKYMLFNKPDENEKVFSVLSWAGYLKDWSGPQEGEMPSAYIILLGDTAIAKNFQYDAGIACQSITLGAQEKGLGACIIGGIKRETLRENLAIPEQFEILLVLALGKPAERVVLEKMGENDDVKYWRDEKDIHHVPKRALGDLIIN